MARKEPELPEPRILLGVNAVGASRKRYASK